MAERFPMFHWSPTSRYKGICRYGLVPGKPSTDRAWRPPYVAFSDAPDDAWRSVEATDGVALHSSWVLWLVYSDLVPGFEVLWLHGDLTEYRVYERIYKRDVWYVGTRARDAAR